MIKIAISCYMSQTFWTANEFRPETKTRTLPTIDAKPESENRQSVCRRSAKKQDPPHRQETHRLAQTKPTVSTQSGGGPSEILFSCHFRLAPKLGRRSPIAKFTYCRHSRKILARPSERRASKKMNQLGPSKSPLGRTRILADVQLGTALAPSYTRNARANRGRSNFSMRSKMPVSAGQPEFTGRRTSAFPNQSQSPRLTPCAVSPAGSHDR